MSGILDKVLVGTVVLFCIGYAIASLGPRGLRKQILSASSRAVRSAPAFLRLEKVARRLDAAAAKGQGACGGCEDCGTGKEIKVPVGKIGRRA
jgi:hypothetical protein